MTELSESEILLNTCQGCIFGITKQIKGLLNKKNID
jgi:hypothetical protein